MISWWLQRCPYSSTIPYSWARPWEKQVIYFSHLLPHYIVLYLYCFRCRSLRTPANILVVNLAFSDLLMMMEMPAFVYNSIHLGPATGQTGNGDCMRYDAAPGLAVWLEITLLTSFANNQLYIDLPASIDHRLEWLHRVNNISWIIVTFITFFSNWNPGATKKDSSRERNNSNHSESFCTIFKLKLSKLWTVIGYSFF